MLDKNSKKTFKIRKKMSMFGQKKKKKSLLLKIVNNIKYLVGF